MPRTKGGPKTRHRRKRILKLAKGYWGARRKLYAVARETVDRALAYAFAGRKQKKRQYRRLWIARINAGLGSQLSYSRFIHGLKQARIDLDRRALADLAAHDPAAFARVVGMAKEHV
ncbi:MAG: 50S ribosomal protein L20 [Deltaproteobacteria bacterium]|nr:MAG: 50S ribosomal protein L20 [Deltaproteobacteria bacterium]